MSEGCSQGWGGAVAAAHLFPNFARKFPKFTLGDRDTRSTQSSYCLVSCHLHSLLLCLPRHPSNLPESLCGLRRVLEYPHSHCLGLLSCVPSATFQTRWWSSHSSSIALRAVPPQGLCICLPSSQIFAWLASEHSVSSQRPSLVTSCCALIAFIYLLPKLLHVLNC